MTLSVADIDHLTTGHFGEGKVVRVRSAVQNGERSETSGRRCCAWRLEQGFATYHCARSGESGHACDHTATPPDSVRLVAARRAAEVRERRAARQRLGKAHWLWPHRKPKQKPKPKRDDMNDEIPFVLAAVAMIPLLAMLAGSGTLL